MSAQPTNVHFSEPVLANLQERAEQENKGADQPVNELVMTDLQRRKLIPDLMSRP